MTDAARVLAVIVLYRMEPERSKTLTGLAQAFAEDPVLAEQIDVLVWDNSPQPLGAGKMPLRCTYRHAATNEGVSGAYNAVAEIAAADSRGWLLLLDQDTSITGTYLCAMLGELERVAQDEHTAAVAPFLYAGDFPLSPRLWRFGRHIPIPRPAVGYAERRPMFAANSGVLMRVAALEAVGGYSRRFWLDYSDIELFHRLHAQGFSVWIAPGASLQHEVSMLDYDSRMTPGRYASYLAAESDFLDLHRGVAERLLHLGRLAARVMKQRRLRELEFSRMTARELQRRIVRRRKTRLRDATS